MFSRPQFPPISFLLSQVPPTPDEPLLFTGATLDLDLPPGLYVIRGAWNLREDTLLRNAVGRFGTDQWDSVAAVIPGRSATQCRERWTFRIGPGLNKSPFEKWEDDLILRERETIGNHWTVIASHLRGRTSCAVKNRWYSVLRKQDRKQQPIADPDPCKVRALLSHPVSALGDVCG
jgi:hypothetical protein